MALISANGHEFEVSCVVFDKDGTLLDLNFTWGNRTADWVRALATLAARDEPQFEYYAQAIGFDWVRKQILSDGPLAVTTAQKLVTLAAGALYRQGYAWHDAEHLATETMQETMDLPILVNEVRPVGDVIGTIQRLKNAGLLIAVVTGDDRKPTESTLSHLGIANDIAAIVCGDDPLPEKPDPAGLFHIESQLGISTKQMLMVGDSINDMLTGRNAAVAGCIGITGSTGNAAKLAAYADVVLLSIDQLSVI